ncbi:MAG: putative Ig domain-containing protein, partial [Hyphomicrobiaceae bacterium]|nr:putative Ig domain-containing protein [Hyphomicrobiaceae bacterium]
AALPVTQTFSIGKAAVIIVLSPTLPDGDQGVAYSATVTASGGAEPYTFAVTSGALPPGLTLNPASGTVSGTPTGNGTFGFTITANDGASNTGSQAYTIMIGTGFIEQRTTEVNRNFLQHRADMVTSQEPGRVHNFRRLGDSLMGGNGGSGAQMSGGGGVPFNLGMTPNADGGVSKVTFSTSLQQMLQAKRSDRFSADGTGRMALGGADSS